jgi:hypothetical protein
LAALALPACHNEGEGDGGGGGAAPSPENGSAGSPSSLPPVRLATPLSGGQEAPPVFTFGRGTASFLVPSDRRSIRFDLSFTNLTGVTMAHLHVGALGVDGPIVFPLSSQPFVSPLSGTLTAGDFQPQPGVPTFEAAVDALLRGDLFVNVHTLAWPDGEIRGQVGPARFQTSLAGFKVLPPVSSTGSGFAVLQLDAPQESIAFTLDVANLSGPATRARLHVAPPGLNGPAVFDLSPTGFDRSVSGTLTAADLQPQPGAGVTEFGDVVDALLRGDAYVTVSTAAFPLGEIRGDFGTTPEPEPPFPPGLTRPTIMMDPVTGQIIFTIIPVNTAPR